MKKILICILIIASMLLLSSCEVVESVIGDIDLPFLEFFEEDQSDKNNGDDVPAHDGENGKDDGAGDQNKDPESDDKQEDKHDYLDFSYSEKALFNRYIGAIIPFIPTDAYYVEGYYDTNDYEHGMNYYTIGNTEAEFKEYLKSYSDYTLAETYQDEYGDTWYCFVKDDVTVDLTYCLIDGQYYVDVYVYSALSKDITDDDTNQGGNTDDQEGSPADEWAELYDCITVKEALDVCKQTGSSKSDRYYMIATVVSVEDDYYGKMTVKDSTGSILVYGTYGADGKDRYGDLTVDVPKAGDTVLFYGNFMTYGSTPEMYSGWIIDFFTPGGENQGGNDQGGGGSSSVEHIYTEFSSDEFNLIFDILGIPLPFIPSDEYYVDEYELDGEYGINYYAFGNTKEEFSEYLDKFYLYSYDGSYEDDYGDTWYCYSVDYEIYIDVSHYYFEGDYVVDLYAYYIIEDGDSGSGSGDSGNTGGGQEDDKDVITNSGAGLPEDADGVVDVDFTKAENVKDVTDQGYYLDGCPTVGSPAVLVIPVDFIDSTAQSKGYTTDTLVNAFAKDGVTDYYSVYDYYYISSYGKLDLDVTVLDYWFRPQYSSTYYYNATYDYYGEQIAIGDQLILDEALAYLEAIMDLSDFDSDGNGIIDAVVLVNTLDVGEEDFYWAYRYWNVYTDDEGYFFEYDGVSANDYMWVSYQFLHEGYNDSGETVYTDTDAMNTYTFIHEFGHLLGADDYYDTEYNYDPMYGCDIMDSMLGDHNPYTKFNLGWITSSRLVVTDTSVTLTLGDFAVSGDTVIIANNWNEKLGAYQEYYVIIYYKNTGLNAGENAGYFARDGVVVYHVNSSLFKEVIDGETYYDVYNNNTSPSSEYGSEDNLIEYVKSAKDTFTYIEGDTMPDTVDDMGDPLSFTFTVDSVTEEYATITFTAK